MKSKVLSGLLVLSLAITALAVNEPAIIPQPKNLTRLAGTFKLAADTRIFVDSSSLETGDFLAARLRKSTGWRFLVSRPTTPDLAVTNGILLTTNAADGDLGAEGYELVAGTNAVVIRAPSQAGLFYGVQTLLQLLPPEVFSSKTAAGMVWEIPCVNITDQPRFGWRGLMLDVSRHFFTKEEVKELLDAAAMHKINTFHWHLVDNNGWRIEIKKYPRLTSVGAWRAGVGFDLPTNSTTAYGPDGRYGGFYTQDDIREVVAYAAARHVTIVPEIEMPGHSLAALSAYPEFGTGDGPFVAALKRAPEPGIFSPAKAGVFEFLDGVLTEVSQLFPGEYIHIGGDEVPKGPWKKDAACQELMKHEGLKNEEELQNWFIRRVEKIVTAKGKKILGWSEILQGGLTQNAAVMDWIGGGREAASQDHDVVMTPSLYCYFDYYQSRNRPPEPTAIGGFLPLERVYGFEPIPAGLTPDKQRHILGAQGNLWTEYMPNLKQVEYMTFPRLCALAEVTWSPKESRDYENFLQRLKTNEQRLHRLGVNYRAVALGDGVAALKIGGWTSEQIKTEPAVVEWDVTTRATNAGKVNVNFDQTEGVHGINIAWVSLLEDGKEISRDPHAGFSGSSAVRARRPDYTLKIPAPKPGAHYTFRALIAGDGGTDSYGDVCWIFVPTATK